MILQRKPNNYLFYIYNIYIFDIYIIYTHILTYYILLIYNIYIIVIYIYITISLFPLLFSEVSEMFLLKRKERRKESKSADGRKKKRKQLMKERENVLREIMAPAIYVWQRTEVLEELKLWVLTDEKWLEIELLSIALHKWSTIVIKGTQSISVLGCGKMEKGKEQVLLPKARNLNGADCVLPYWVISTIPTGAKALNISYNPGSWVQADYHVVSFW